MKEWKKVREYKILKNSSSKCHTTNNSSKSKWPKTLQTSKNKSLFSSVANIKLMFNLNNVQFPTVNSNNFSTKKLLL